MDFLLDGIELSEEQVSLLDTEGSDDDDDDDDVRRKRNLKFMECYNCGKRGRLSKDCRSPRRNQGVEKDAKEVGTVTDKDASSNSNAAPRLT